MHGEVLAAVVLGGLHRLPRSVQLEGDVAGGEGDRKGQGGVFALRVVQREAGLGHGVVEGDGAHRFHAARGAFHLEGAGLLPLGGGNGFPHHLLGVQAAVGVFHLHFGGQDGLVSGQAVRGGGLRLHDHGVGDGDLGGHGAVKAVGLALHRKGAGLGVAVGGDGVPHHGNRGGLAGDVGGLHLGGQHGGHARGGGDLHGFHRYDDEIGYPHRRGDRQAVAVDAAGGGELAFGGVFGGVDGVPGHFGVKLGAVQRGGAHGGGQNRGHAHGGVHPHALHTADGIVRQHDGRLIAHVLAAGQLELAVGAERTGDFDAEGDVGLAVGQLLVQIVI